MARIADLLNLGDSEGDGREEELAEMDDPTSVMLDLYGFGSGSGEGREEESGEGERGGEGVIEDSLLRLAVETDIPSSDIGSSDLRESDASSYQPLLPHPHPLVEVSPGLSRAGVGESALRPTTPSSPPPCAPLFPPLAADTALLHSNYDPLLPANLSLLTPSRTPCSPLPPPSPSPAPSELSNFLDHLSLSSARRTTLGGLTREATAVHDDDDDDDEGEAEGRCRERERIWRTLSTSARAEGEGGVESGYVAAAEEDSQEEEDRASSSRAEDLPFAETPSALYLSCQILDFGELEHSEHKKLHFTLSNTSNTAPVAYRIYHSASTEQRDRIRHTHTRLSPALLDGYARVLRIRQRTGILDPGRSRSISVRLSPAGVDPSFFPILGHSSTIEVRSLLLPEHAPRAPLPHNTLRALFRSQDGRQAAWQQYVHLGLPRGVWATTAERVEEQEPRTERLAEGEDGAGREREVWRRVKAVSSPVPPRTPSSTVGSPVTACTTITQPTPPARAPPIDLLRSSTPSQPSPRVTLADAAHPPPLALSPSPKSDPTIIPTADETALRLSTSPSKSDSPLSLLRLVDWLGMLVVLGVVYWLSRGVGGGGWEVRLWAGRVGALARVGRGLV